MPHLLTRALACARTSTPLQQSTRLPLRPLYQSIPSTASLSYKTNPNAAKKILPKERPIARPRVAAPTASPEALSSMPYLIRRTAFGQLPVYRTWKAGGTLESIQIKKITGDKQILIDELKSKLAVPEDKIRINPNTGHIELKGKYLDQTIQHLVEKGL